MSVFSNSMKFYFARMKASGHCPARKPLHKIVWSTLGSFLGIGLIAGLQPLLTISSLDAMYIVGSFGASAVLIYGAPLAEFSQPRNLIGGHVLSALVGVTVYKAFGGIPVLPEALAVSLSIAVMHFSCTLHPPGGATALIAVVGGQEIHSLSYSYTFVPILVGAIVLLLVALFVNNMSTNPNRHYPVYWY